MDHEIEPGARISIDGLARQLQVSPTPVREALARLESAQLVTKEPLRGYRATALLTRDELTDLYQFRLLIEPWAARCAAERATARDRRQLRHEMSTTQLPRSRSYEAYKALAAHDTRLHVLIAELSGSERVRQAFERTHCHMHIFRLGYHRQIGAETLAEHERIVDAIVRGDPAGAERAMREHLETSCHQRLVPLYDAAGQGTG
ncbi:GntR family transcriptional regulator [Prauserella muralis]|uniref:GntR family transcriptional regulator n=2 Tax=Prauserella muralis TaxID=588067 RepID=A0A2V4APH7_9PSEU|nr:GntR family transcriptional regulator [Prauserella muralis]